MSKRTVVSIIVILLVISVFGVTFYLIDFNLVVRNNEPKLSVNTNTYNEGSTKEYLGLGYKIIRYNIQNERAINKFGTWFMMYDPDYVIKEENKNIDETYDIIGEVKLFDKEELALEVKSNSETSKYDNAIVKIDSDTIIKKENVNVDTKELKVGANVKVIFNGMLTRSIPPQAIATLIIIE